MLKLSASPEGEIYDPSRRLLTNAATIDEPHVIPLHHHSRSQLLCISSGRIKVTVDGRCWTVSSGNAIWIQSGAFHEVYAGEAVEYRSIYLDPTTAKSVPLSSGVVEMKPLIKELIHESVLFGNTYLPNSPESRINDVLLDNLRKMKYETCPIVMPINPKLSKLCEVVLDNPSIQFSLDEWGKKCGASGRNLARIFKRQTGVSYTQWCNRVRVFHAVERLKAGDSVTTISISLGYANCSAFTHMFKSVTGLKPREYKNKDI